jgi:hypothetical protein
VGRDTSLKQLSVSTTVSELMDMILSLQTCIAMRQISGILILHSDSLAGSHWYLIHRQEKSFQDFLVRYPNPDVIK